jgi:hypothetical protein
MGGGYKDVAERESGEGCLSQGQALRKEGVGGIGRDCRGSEEIPLHKPQDTRKGEKILMKTHLEPLEDFAPGTAAATDFLLLSFFYSPLC